MAAILLPSADEVMEVLNPTGAVVGAQLNPALVEA
jgi:hypothetical protein